MIKISKYDKKYNKEDFDCENDDINNYLKTRISQEIKNHSTNCFYLISENEKIIGYYTLTAAAINLSDIPNEYKLKLPKYQNVGCALLGRLGIDKNHKNKGFGKILIYDAMKRSFDNDIMVTALIIDAKDENLAQYYKKLGFQSLISNPLRLFITRPKDWK